MENHLKNFAIPRKVSWITARIWKCKCRKEISDKDDIVGGTCRAVFSKLIAGHYYNAAIDIAPSTMKQTRCWCREDGTEKDFQEFKVKLESVKGRHR